MIDFNQNIVKVENLNFIKLMKNFSPGFHHDNSPHDPCLNNLHDCADEALCVYQGYFRTEEDLYRQLAFDRSI